MKPLLYSVLPVLALAACSAEETSAPAKEAEEKAVTETAEKVEKATETAMASENLCLDSGPQTPRDISSKLGLNTVNFPMAGDTTEMNLCNIHTHTNAEHKGPGFSVFVNDTDSGGYACNDAGSLTAEELRDPTNGTGAYKGVKPGDTIEVHWVHTSCDIEPGEGLGSCLSDTCENPLLRVEAQTFLVVNDPNALDFTDFDYGNTVRNGFHQPKALPTGTGTPVVFRGSTTGPSYNQSTCSPLQVTWSVRPQCARVDISSLHKWAEEGNVFNETKSHGVRQLVTAPELLSPIE
jgi:hypothetical protein